VGSSWNGNLGIIEFGRPAVKREETTVCTQSTSVVWIEVLIGAPSVVASSEPSPFTE